MITKEVGTGPGAEIEVAYEFVFGGTFDPVHFGHIEIVELLSNFERRWPIRVIPCAVPALKSTPQVSFEHRVAMLKLALNRYPQVVIDERESHRQQTSYTVDTLHSLRMEQPATELIFVVGADSLADIEHWYQWQKLRSLCHLLVLNRPGYSIESLQNKITASGFLLVTNFTKLCQLKCGNLLALTMPERPQSSTEIRNTVINNQPLDSMLPQSVIEYIGNHHLYKSK